MSEVEFLDGRNEDETVAMHHETMINSHLAML